MEAPLSPPSQLPGDETVRLTISPSTPTTLSPVKSSSSPVGDGASWRLVIIPIIHLHGMCLILTWRGNQGFGHDTHWWSVIGYWCSSHLCLLSTLGPRVRQIILTGQGFIWSNPGPSEAALILRDGDLKAFEVSTPPLHIPLKLLLGRFHRLIFVSLREVFELPSEPSPELLNVVQ